MDRTKVTLGAPRVGLYWSTYEVFLHIYQPAYPYFCSLHPKMTGKIVVQ